MAGEQYLRLFADHLAEPQPGGSLMCVVQDSAKEAFGVPGPVMTDSVTTTSVPDEQADDYLSIHEQESGNTSSHPRLLPFEPLQEVGMQPVEL